MKYKILMAFILGIAFIIRVVGISSYPVGFTQDEAGIGYDAYSLLQTGRDQWGNSWPLVLRSFGDFKLPLYSYLAIPSIFIFGLNEFAVRFPSAIFGTLAVLATYLMVYELTRKRKFALWSGLFLALSPWHISLSRGAFEANLTTFFLPFAIWSFYKGIRDTKWMSVAAFVFGLNLFTYHSARLFTPVIVFLLMVQSQKDIKKSLGRNWSYVSCLKKYRWSILVLSFLSLLALYTMLTGAGNRGMDIAIFNPTDEWASMANRRLEAIQEEVPNSVARIFSNKVTYVFDVFTQNYLSYLSPVFLFTQGVKDWGYGMIPGRGVLYLFEIFLLIASIIACFRGKGFKGFSLIFYWIVLSPISAALAKGSGYSGTRAAVMMPAIQILSAYGVVYLSQKLGRYLSGNLVTHFFQFLIIALLIVSATFFAEDYLYHAPKKAASSMKHGTKETVGYLTQVEDDYQKIRISRSMSVPQIWVGFYQKRDPVEFQKASKDWLRYEREGYVSIDQLDQYSLGKYTFGNIFFEDRRNEVGTLFVGKPEDFPSDITPKKIIYDLNNDPFLFVVDSDGL